MLTVSDYARIRYAYYVEKESMKEIERKWGHSYWTIRKALARPEPAPYQREKAKEAPVLGAYKARIEEMLAENERLPRKQRYTSRKIYETIQQLGYAGAESSVRRYVGQVRKARRRPAVFLPLAFDPGQDAQVDWGEAQVVMAGEERTVQLFIMRLCYSRRRFVMAFPTQRQEAFFWGHVQAFAHFQGIPQRISYDNLKTAVQRILVGRNRQEQSSFASLRRARYVNATTLLHTGSRPREGRGRERCGLCAPQLSHPSAPGGRLQRTEPAPAGGLPDR